MQPNQNQPGAQVDPFDPFAAVPLTFGGGLPGARHLEGRVVIIQPVRVDETTLGYDKKTVTPTLIADIIVVDGGPLVYGDQVTNTGQQTKPASHRVDTPARFTGWMDSHPYIVGPCRDLLRVGTPITVGIIERGTQGNRPYFLTETHTDVNRQPRTDPRFAQRRQLAIDVWNAFQTGAWTPPTPVELNPQPVAQAAPQGFAWASQQQSAPTAQPVTQGWGQPAQPAAAQPLAAPQQNLAAFAAGWGQPAQPLTPSSPPVRDLSTPVPGLEAVWSQATEEQKRQAWTMFDQQSAQAAPAATPFG